MAKKSEKNLKPTINNKRASFEYHFEETFEAGIMFTGTEIKSVRDARVQMQDAYCFFVKNELFISNLEISLYTEGTYNNHEPKRLRKLLLHKIELRKLKEKLKNKGFTIIPSKIFFNERNIAKIVIHLAKGKNTFDKRETLKEKDAKREIDRTRD